MDIQGPGPASTRGLSQVTEISKDKAREAIDLAQGFLRRVLKRLMTVDREWGPSHQWAVRIVKSRIRLLDRLWDANYSEGTTRDKARQELKLTHQDDGSLLTIGDRHHAVGRFSCQACDTDYRDESSTVPLTLSRLCTTCSLGIQHAGTIPTPIMDLKIDPGTDNPSGNRVYKPVWVCDGCGLVEDRA